MSYDTLSGDYDRFVDWPGRLAYELPFLERLLEPAARPGGPAVKLLDAACGTGMHAIALAQRGYSASGADLSAGMIERARANAAAAGTGVRFAQAGFGELASAFGDVVASGGFDALLCLGNSLPHVANAAELARALSDFTACLRPAGRVVLQNRNFDAVMARRERWMAPQGHREGPDEWLFVRFYDFTPGGKIDFQVLNLHRTGEQPWQQTVMSTSLLPLLEADLRQSLQSAGLDHIESYGDLAGSPFDPQTSGNLVIVGEKVGRE